MKLVCTIYSFDIFLFSPAPTVKLDSNLTIVPPPNAFGHRNETLQKLLTQTEETTSQPNEQKQRIKIAFAEGYIAANKPGSARKMLEVSISRYVA